MRRISILFTLLAGLAAPLGAQETRLAVPYTRHVLPNGLNVILHEDHTTPTVSVNLWYRVGSAREAPGRTGFAHLFEHILFEGSEHVPEGMFDAWLEAAGGDMNGSTNPDRTNYYADVPANALELALYLESDRMGFLLPALTPAKLDGQREVVKNERRQSYENRPYGLAPLVLLETLYPPDHPYHWPTIGSMDDLSAATHEDVVRFFERYYGPGNASLSIAGDIDPERALSLVETWFGGIPAGPPVPPIDPPAAALREEKRVTLEDEVQLPRLYLCWLTPALYAPGDAELDILSGVLAGGKSSRLYRRLVYELQIAQDVSAVQASGELASRFCITTTARSGHDAVELERVVQEELDRLEAEPPSAAEVERAVNQFELGFLDRLERVGGFGGKADQLNGYFVRTGNPDWFQEDLARYWAIDPVDVQAVLRTYLKDDARVILTVVPAAAPADEEPATEEEAAR